MEFLCCSLCSWCVSYGNIHTSYRRIRSCFRFLLVRKGTLEFLIFVGFQRSAMPSLQKLANVYYRESFVFFGFWLDFCRLPKIGSAVFSKCCECLISKKSCSVIVGVFVLCATRSESFGDPWGSVGVLRESLGVPWVSLGVPWDALEVP